MWRSFALSHCPQAAVTDLLSHIHKRLSVAVRTTPLNQGLLGVQALSSNKPYPAGVGGSGMALAFDGSVALLSGSPATATSPANAFLFSFYTSANQYNSCPQQISVRHALLLHGDLDPAQVDKHPGLPGLPQCCR